MTATAPLKYSPYMKEMAQADTPKQANTIPLKNEWLVATNKIRHYFKEWTTANSVLKKIYCF